MRLMNGEALRILVVGPFMHRKGHFAIFPTDLAEGFSLNGADVTLLHPFKAATGKLADRRVKTICLDQQLGVFNPLMRLSWRIFQKKPLLLCLAWTIFQTRKDDYDLVYWTDFEPDNQQSSWPLGLLSIFGLYRHRTAFTEHHNFSWSKHRWQRLFRLDRIRLRQIEMFVHSRKLLEWIRLNMNWPGKGHYLPWGLWPDPATNHERNAARQYLGIPHDARVILVFGMQAVRRKRIDTLADAIASLPLDTPLTVMFAGTRINKDERHPFEQPELIAKHNLQIQYHESFIDDEAIKRFFAAADAVWAYYGTFIGASGVLAQAIAHGRLSIASDSAEIGEICRKYGVGLLAPTEDREGVQRVISKFLSMCSLEQDRFESAARMAAHEMAWPRITQQILDTLFINSKNE